MNVAVGKISRGIGMLCILRNIFIAKIQRMYFSILVDPHLRYFSSVWGCAVDTILRKLQKLQNWAAHFVTSSSFQSNIVAIDVTTRAVNSQ